MRPGAQLAPRPERDVSATVAWGATAAASILLVVLGMLVTAGWTPLLALDHDVTGALVLRGAGADVRAVRLVTDLGSALPRIAVLGTLVIWLAVQRRWRVAGFAALAGVVVSPVTDLLKAAFDRPRPDVAGTAYFAGLSYPSGHSAGTAMLGGVVVVTAWHVAGWRLARRVLLFAVALALAVGYSRIALGAHYLTDVIAGWLLGAIIVVVLARCFGLWPDRSSIAVVGPAPTLSTGSVRT